MESLSNYWTIVNTPADLAADLYLCWPDSDRPYCPEFVPWEEQLRATGSAADQMNTGIRAHGRFDLSVCPETDETTRYLDGLGYEYPTVQHGETRIALLRSTGLPSLPSTLIPNSRIDDLIYTWASGAYATMARLKPLERRDAVRVPVGPDVLVDRLPVLVMYKPEAEKHITSVTDYRTEARVICTLILSGWSLDQVRSGFNKYGLSCRSIERTYRNAIQKIRSQAHCAYWLDMIHQPREWPREGRGSYLTRQVYEMILTTAYLKNADPTKAFYINFGDLMALSRKGNDSAIWYALGLLSKEDRKLIEFTPEGDRGILTKVLCTTTVHISICRSVEVDPLNRSLYKTDLLNLTNELPLSISAVQFLSSCNYSTERIYRALGDVPQSITELAEKTSIHRNTIRPCLKWLLSYDLTDSIKSATFPYSLLYLRGSADLETLARSWKTEQAERGEVWTRGL